MIINKFQTLSGCAELFIALESENKGSFRSEVSAVLCELKTAIPANFKLVWVRFHVSDIANQYAEIESLTHELSAMIAVTGQAPLSGAHIAVEAYAVDMSGTIQCDDGNICKLDFENYSQIFFVDHLDEPCHFLFDVVIVSLKREGD